MWVLKYIIVPVTCSLEKKRKKNQICHYSECVVIYLAGGQGGYGGGGQQGEPCISV